MDRKSLWRTRGAAAMGGAGIMGAAVLTLTLVLSNASSGVAGATGVRSHALTQGSEMSLTIPGISGDGTSRSSTDIEVQGFSWGVENLPKTTKSTFDTLTVTTPVDQSSPLLLTAAAARTVFPTVTLHVASPPGTTKGDSEAITLTGVGMRAVSDCCQAGAGYTNNFTISISFTFKKVTIDYLNGATSAKVHGGWDLAQNKKA